MAEEGRSFVPKKRRPQKAERRAQRPKSDHTLRSVRKRRSANAFQRAYRRRRILRWVMFALVLPSLGTLVYGTPTSKPQQIKPVVPVETGSLADFPEQLLLDMDELWVAAKAQDFSPNLAASGNTVTSGRRVALTFDDGPDPHTTPLVLDTLQEHNIKATFFVVGRYVRENPDLLRRVVEEGHTLGNHTYNHANLSTLRPKQMRQELQRTQQAVDEVLGYHYPMTLMRPPYGNPYYDGSAMLKTFQRVIRKQELFTVLWTPSPHDYLFSGQPERIVEDVVLAYEKSQVEGREDSDRVLLLHDTHQQTADALPWVIEFYKSLGLQFTDVNELLAHKYFGE